MKKLILICLCFVCVPLYAQKYKDVSNVCKEYQKLKMCIAQLGNEDSEFEDENDESTLYCDYVEVNQSGTSWPASGNYHIDYNYYYTLDGDDCSYGGPCPDLRFVEVKTEVAAAYINEEWLFKDGNLVFAYIQDAYNDEIEQRAYLKDGKLILYTENNEIASPPDNYTERLLVQANWLQDRIKGK